MCPDIKIASPREDFGFYQFDALGDVDYVKFESRLQHKDPTIGDICNIYVQIHDRGLNRLHHFVN
jgi:hypothetical protein